MSQLIRRGAALFGRIVLVTVMSLFICVSMSVLCTAGFTQKIGYEVYGYQEKQRRGGLALQAL